MMLAGLYRYYDNEEEKGIVSYGRGGFRIRWHST
jgi:hypothetical protein